MARRSYYVDRDEGRTIVAVAMRKTRMWEVLCVTTDNESTTSKI